MMFFIGKGCIKRQVFKILQGFHTEKNIFYNDFGQSKYFINHNSLKFLYK
jgi:hypothetical protein